MKTDFLSKFGKKYDLAVHFDFNECLQTTQAISVPLVIVSESMSLIRYTTEIINFPGTLLLLIRFAISTVRPECTFGCRNSKVGLQSKQLAASMVYPEYFNTFGCTNDTASPE